MQSPQTKESRSALRSIALWATAGLLVLLVVLIAWVFTANLGILKPQLERWISAQTGREFRIDGTFSARLGRTGILVAEDMRFANASWATEANMVEVGRLEVRVDLWSLVSGPVVVELIDLDDAILELAVADTGDNNWTIARESKEAPKVEATELSAPRIHFRQVSVDDVRIHYDSADRAGPLDLHIESVTQEQLDGDSLKYALKAMVGDRHVTLDLDIGTWQAMLAGKDVRYEVEGQLDTFRFSSEGRIDDLAKPTRPDLRFAASGPDIDDLTRLLGLGEEGEGDIAISGSLTPQTDGPLVAEVHGNIGRTQIDANGAFSSLQDFEAIDIEANASGDDLRYFLLLAGLKTDLAAPFTVAIHARRQGPLLEIYKSRMEIGSATLDLTANMPQFPAVKGGQFNLDINGTDIERVRDLLGIKGAAAGAFSLHSELEVGTSGEEILLLELKTTLVDAEARADFGTGGEINGSEVQFDVTTDNLAKIAGAYGVSDLPKRPLAIRGKVRVVEGGIEIIDKIAVKSMDMAIDVGGRLATASGLRDSDATFRVAGPDLQKIAADFGVLTGVPALPYEVTGRVQVRDKDFRLSDVAGTIGNSKLGIDGSLVNNKAFTGSRFDFRASGPALEQLLEGIDDFEIQPGPFELSGAVELESDAIDLTGVKLARGRGNVALDLRLGLPLSTRKAEFDLQADGKDIGALLQSMQDFRFHPAPYKVDTAGRLHGSKLTFDRHSASIGEAQMQANGVIDFGATRQTSDFHVSGNIPSLAKFGQFGDRPLRDQSLRWNAHVESNRGSVQIEDFTVKLDESDIRGAVRLSPGEVPYLTVAVRSDSIVLKPLPAEAPLPKKEKEAGDGRLIPDVKLPVEWMHKLNASVNLDIGELKRDALHVRDISVRSELADGVLDLSRFRFLAPAGGLDARARVESAAGTLNASLEIVARDFALGLADINRNLERKSSLDINLQSSGSDLRSLAAHSNGVMLVDIRRGQLADIEILNQFYGDIFEQILGAINPLKASATETRLECLILPYEIVEGHLSSRPHTFLSTDAIRVTSKTDINLATEAIELEVRTVPRKGLGVSAGSAINPYVKVVGTLASPRLVVDTQGVLVSGGAAVATGGLTIVARMGLDRLTRSQDACGMVSEEANKALSDRFPKFDP